MITFVATKDKANWNYPLPVTFLPLYLYKNTAIFSSFVIYFKHPAYDFSEKSVLFLYPIPKSIN